MFQQVAPILATTNLQATSSYYKEKLDFTISYFGNYLVVSRPNIQLFFYENRDKNSFRRSSCFIFVNNIEDLYSKFSSLGMIDPNGRLQEKPGGLKEFAIADNNGHVLRFGQKA